jgi:hypothetical protein
MSDLIVRIKSPSEGIKTSREGGSVGPNMCGDWERWRPKFRSVIHKHRLFFRSVYAATFGLQSFGPREMDADGTST